jgi:hypothetical protein
VVQGLGFQWLCAALGFHVQAARIHPGLYALVGGTAMLAGVFRSAISLVVIMLEGTGEEKPSCDRGRTAKYRNIMVQASLCEADIVAWS